MGQDTSNNFVGVSPEYQNSADITGQPFRSEEGPEKELEDILIPRMDAVDKATDEGEGVLHPVVAPDAEHPQAVVSATTDDEGGEEGGEDATVENATKKGPKKNS